MRCKKCGAGLTGLSNSKWWCQYCQTSYTTEELKVRSLDTFIKKEVAQWQKGKFAGREKKEKREEQSL